jgi:hypothetical protein
LVKRSLKRGKRFPEEISSPQRSPDLSADDMIFKQDIFFCTLIREIRLPLRVVYDRKSDRDTIRRRSILDEPSTRPKRTMRSAAIDDGAEIERRR